MEDTKIAIFQKGDIKKHADIDWRGEGVRYSTVQYKVQYGTVQGTVQYKVQYSTVQYKVQYRYRYRYSTVDREREREPSQKSPPGPL